ncbi:MAG TPA: CPBP family intramembrane glutamic endopeptidase, partial [Solirubrobacteraceae bacterium]
ASPESVVGLVILLIAYTVVAPVGEELVFRGYLLRALADSRVGPVCAILVTALVWASLHIDKSWLGIADTFFAGLVWGWLRWRTESTLPTIAVHALTNLVASSGVVALALGVS